MRKRLTIWIAAVVVLCVLAIFISPAVHLPRTALRAQKLAMLTMLALLAAATAIFPLTPFSGLSPERLGEATRPHPLGSPCVRELGCVRRC
jgi:hypothetical protein